MTAVKIQFVILYEGCWAQCPGEIQTWWCFLLIPHIHPVQHSHRAILSSVSVALAPLLLWNYFEFKMCKTIHVIPLYVKAGHSGSQQCALLGWIFIRREEQETWDVVTILSNTNRALSPSAWRWHPCPHFSGTDLYCISPVAYWAHVYFYLPQYPVRSPTGQKGLVYAAYEDTLLFFLFFFFLLWMLVYVWSHKAANGHWL